MPIYYRVLSFTGGCQPGAPRLGSPNVVGQSNIAYTPVDPWSRDESSAFGPVSTIVISTMHCAALAAQGIPSGSFASVTANIGIISVRGIAGQSNLASATVQIP